MALPKSRLVYLSASFALFLIALPLISFGTTRGPRLLLWIGFAALCIATLIPPLYRLVLSSQPSSDSEWADETVGSNRKEGSR